MHYQDAVSEQEHLTTLSRDFDPSVWGDDAPGIWEELSASPIVEFPTPGIAVVAGHEAVDTVLRQPNLFSSGPKALYFGSDTGAIPLQMDPPNHTPYRKVLDLLFAPKRVAEKEPELVAVANDLIDGFIGRGSVDFAKEFAGPFPATVFLALMGMRRELLAEFLDVKNALIRPAGATLEEREQNTAKAGMFIHNYFTEELDRRVGKDFDDLLGYFVRLETDGKLTREEILNICHLFLPAGLDTVTATLGCSFRVLADRPDLQQRLANEPDMIAPAVEELLRYTTPVPVVVRYSTADSVVDGCPIPAGTRVRPMLSTTNFDPNIFPHPEAINIDRTVNPHVTFGSGIHRCVGSHLARLELRVALREWHRRIPSYRIQDGFVVEYRQGIREIPHLPLQWTQ